MMLGLREAVTSPGFPCPKRHRYIKLERHAIARAHTGAVSSVEAIRPATTGNLARHQVTDAKLNSQFRALLTLASRSGYDAARRFLSVRLLKSNSI